MSNQEDGALYRTTFPPEVQGALTQVLPSNDPLDHPDFDPVDYINTLFPNEQSLANVDEVMLKLRNRIGGLDDEIRAVVRRQTVPNADGRTSLKEAQTSLHHLFAAIKDIKEKSESSEQRVKEITRDIKQLDHAKRHLTSSIKTLNQMQMLIDGAEKLRQLSRQREYAALAQLLQGVISVLDDFRSFMTIPQISKLSSEVCQIRRELAEQITAEFKDSLGPGKTPRSNIAHACVVLNHLEPQVKRELIEWLVDSQLSEYRMLFHPDQQISWLDHIEKRYSWIKKHLLYFEETVGAIFPLEWEMSERLAVRACEVTRKQLTDIMGVRSSQIEAGLLVNAMTKTSAFELLLSRRFTGVTLTGRVSNGHTVNTNPFEEDTEEKNDASPPTRPRTPYENPFNGLISQCFEAHIHVYMETRSRELSQMMDKFSAEAEHMLPPKVDGSAASTLPSCADLFIFFKKCLVQCMQMPACAGQGLIALSVTFKKYLKEYANRVLQAALPKSGSITSLSSRPLLANLQTLVETGMNPHTRYTAGEVCQICVVLTTAEYCLETVQQLEAKLKEKVSSSNLSDEINFSLELDMFHLVINQSIQLLVSDLEAACEPSFSSMLKMQWSSMEQVGDQSPYINAIASHLTQNMTLLRDALANSRKYLTQFCVKFSSGFISKFIHNMLRCRPVSAVGAEQMLLDTHSLKTVLLDLPMLGAEANLRKAPPSYTKIVTKGMGKAEMILKVVMAALEPYDVFVDSVLRLLPETDLSEFQRILEMKAVKRTDQTILMEMFKAKAGPQAFLSSAAEEKSGGIFSVLNQESGRIMRLEKLLKKKF